MKVPASPSKVLFTINKKKEPNKVRKQATLYFEIRRKVSQLRYITIALYFIRPRC